MQAPKSPAALVVHRYERNGHPNGREAFLELERTYSGREQDERSIMQPFALEGRLRDIRCNAAEEALCFIVGFSEIWSEFEMLGEVKLQASEQKSCLAAQN